MGFISKNLSSLFYVLGTFIAKYPKYFIIVPVVISLFLGAGLTQLNFLSDVEYLYSQPECEAKTHRDFIESVFPPNYTHKFDISRATRVRRYARLIATAKDGGDLLHSAVWDELTNLDALVQNLEIADGNEGQLLDYSKLCAKWNEDCFQNDHLEIGELIEPFRNQTFRLSYPFVFHPKSYKTHAIPQYFGNITLSNDSLNIKSIGAVSLYYFLAVDSTLDDIRGEKWEAELMRRLDETANSWKELKVSYTTLKTFEQEIDMNFFAVLEPLAYIVAVATLFSIVTLMMADWVKSKPWLGIAGNVSAVLGTIASCGLLCWIGVPLCGTAISVPFLMLGIGIDDMFVMLASWRQTSPEHSVPQRLGECYSEAAVSITITTLTDMLSFYIGYLTPIPTIQIFSIYAGTGVLFIYIWHVFFFGGVMALSGYHEADNRHSVFWWMTATPKSKADSLSSFRRVFFTGGIDKADPYNPINTTENFAMILFRDYFSPFISNKFVKLVVMLMFVGYTGVSCLGLSQMEEGLKAERMVRLDSNLQDFFSQDKLYFKKYPFRVQVMISTPLDYSQKCAQDKVFNLLKKMYALDFVTEEYSENWLRDFTRFVHNYEELYETNITSEAEFVNLLREEYLSDKIVSSLDVAFNEKKTKIIATRYMIQVHNTLEFNDEKELLIGLRKVIAEEKDLKVAIYNPTFVYTERNLIIRELTIKIVLMAVVIVMVVAILFIPSFVCCCCVLFSIFSIELGVLGFMSLWGVSLDVVSILCLLMGIGFSVDFSIHISYAYIAGDGDTSEQRITAAMYALGFPIMQGAVSTLLAVAAFPFIPSYSYQTIFKIVFLVIVFATWHALFLLPVLLSMFQPEKGIFSTRKSYALELPPNALHVLQQTNAYDNCENIKTIASNKISSNTILN